MTHLLDFRFMLCEKRYGTVVSARNKCTHFLVDELCSVLAVWLLHHHLPRLWQVKTHETHLIAHTEVGNLNVIIKFGL